MNAFACFIAAGMLPIAAAFTWRMSRPASASLGLTTIATAYWIASIQFHAVPWNTLRWIIASITLLVGCLELRTPGRARWLAALLVGSSCADFVALHREALGQPWIWQPILQIVACVVMVAVSRKVEQQ